MRSGKQIDNQVVNPTDLSENPSQSETTSNESNPNIEHNSEPNPLPTQVDRPTELRAPFPHRLRANKHSEQMEKILEIFKQVKVNIPLLDVIQQVPTYAKFLKDLCTQKWHTQVPKKVFLGVGLSEVLSQSMHVKYNDPSCWYTEYGSKFTLAPKSNKHLLIILSPIVTEIVGQPGSLYLTGIDWDKTSLRPAAKKTFLGTWVCRFWVHKSFKNLA